MLKRVQQLILDALLSDDPVQTLRQRMNQADLSAEEHDCLHRIDADGLVMSSLLIKKLRFERLTAAEPDLAALFEREPERFMRLFTAYTSAVPPTDYFPSQEASRYHQWREQNESPP